MSKYDLSFKLAVVKAYLAGKGSYRTIANDFGIPSHSNVIKWVRLFKERGINELETKKNHEFYPVHFKIDVIQYKLRTGDTLQTTALKYGINEPSIIANWIDIWDQKGIEGLSNKKGKATVRSGNGRCCIQVTAYHISSTTIKNLSIDLYINFSSKQLLKNQLK